MIDGYYLQQREEQTPGTVSSLDPAALAREVGSELPWRLYWDAAPYV